MNEQMLEMLSAYMDGRGTRAERDYIAGLLRQDGQLREALAGLQSLKESLQAAAPPEIQAPPQLRQEVMRRLKTPGSGPNQGTPGSGGRPFLSGRIFPWLVMGGLLAGLITAVAYRDAQVQRRTPAAGGAKIQDDIEVAGQERNSRPDQPGAAMELPPWSAAQEGVDPGSIQSVGFSGNKSAAIREQAVLSGDIYTGGGRAYNANQGKAMNPLAGQALPQISLDQAGQPGRRAYALEETGGWTPQGIREACRQKGRELPVDPQQLLALAQRFNLNPGLLIAAGLYCNPRELENNAEKMRGVLQRTAGQATDEQLRQIVSALAGDDAAWKAWREFLQQP
ncbi:hypothetical protein JW933_10955 [candidate division FCPU426 bacterium]|nr:hypothetical protein [candidate division FCPU426 bacterium]